MFANYSWHTVQIFTSTYKIAFEFLNFIHLLPSYDYAKLTISNFVRLRTSTAFFQLSDRVADKKKIVFS